MFDPYSEMLLGKVYIPLADRMRQLSLDLYPTGVIFKVTQGNRTWQEQADLYSQGRTQPGRIVTNAPPGFSWHQFGVAVDIVPVDQIGKPDWNPQHPVWLQIIHAATELRLFSGSEFRTFKDYPHLQMTGRFGMSPSHEAREILQNVGMEGFWVEAFGA